MGWGGRGPTIVAFQGRESRALRESSKTTKLFTSALPPPPFLPYRTRPVSSSSVVQEQARRVSFSLTITDCLLLCVQIVSDLVNSIRFSGLLSPLQKQTLDDRNTHRRVSR